jgi:hypothetical protein
MEEIILFEDEIDIKYKCKKCGRSFFRDSMKKVLIEHWLVGKLLTRLCTRCYRTESGKKDIKITVIKNE